MDVEASPFSTSLTAIPCFRGFSGFLKAGLRGLPDLGGEAHLSCLVLTALSFGSRSWPDLSPDVGIPLLQLLIYLGGAAHCSAQGLGRLVAGFSSCHCWPALAGVGLGFFLLT